VLKVSKSIALVSREEKQAQILVRKWNKKLNCRRYSAMRMMLILDIQGHARSTVVVPIDAAYMTSY